MPLKLELAGEGIIVELPKTKAASGRIGGFWIHGRLTYLTKSGARIFGVATSRTDLEPVGLVGIYIFNGETYWINGVPLDDPEKNFTFEDRRKRSVLTITPVSQEKVDEEYLEHLTGNKNPGFFRELVYRRRPRKGEKRPTEIEATQLGLWLRD